MALNEPTVPLRDALGSASARAEQTGEDQLLAHRFSLAGCDPLAVWAAAEGGIRFYWEQPDRERALVATGAVLDLTSRGPSRVVDIARRVRDAFACLHLSGEPAPSLAGPLFVGGFAFDDAHDAQGEWSRFPGARLLWPEMLVARIGAEFYCTLSLLVSPGASVEACLASMEDRAAAARAFEGARWLEQVERDALANASVLGARAGGWSAGAEYRVLADRPHAVFRAQVAEAVAAIGAAELEKVVLARSIEVQHPGRFDLPGLLHRLRGIYPQCTTLALGDGEDTLVAATPELVVSLEDDCVRACALAGTGRRGRTPEEDDALGRALLQDEKNLAEHTAVVRALRETLDAVCVDVEMSDDPELMRIEGIHHIATPMRGRLAKDAGRTPDVLDLVGRIHPSPAVAGVPRQASVEWLEKKEGLDRGWYAGPVGFVDRHGEGEFWLALRSGLIRNAERGSPRRATPWARARLFAGAGIVSGSEPELELRETRIKLRALLAPLTEI